MKLLIVDDSEAVRDRVRQMFSARPDLELEEADSVAAGLAALRRMRPEFLILDVQLPDGSGLELLQFAKSELPATRVVMFTNHVFYRKRCMVEGADYFFDKSMDLDGLATVIHEIAQETA